MNRAVMLMLLSLAALNMPQAAVFCIGDDGHMAIEPAGHRHCEDGSHPRNYRATGSEASEHSHIGSPHSRPCVDIPIPAESSDYRFASQRSRLAPILVAGLPPAVETPGAPDALYAIKPPSATTQAFWDASSLVAILQV